MNDLKRFALIGSAGYIAPRHMMAIKENQGELLAATDPHDCMGIMDAYFQDAAYFTEFERFDRHLDKLRRKGQGVHYISVCSPNYLHDAHIRFGLRNHAHVICEKPLVLNPWNLDALLEIEKENEKQIFTILQLRLHPQILHLREKVQASKSDRKFDIELTYLTSRGNWYYASWKGDEQKSGGIATNIGVHFFDMLIWIFGSVQSSIVHQHEHDRAAGLLELENARVRWFLGINPNLLPSATAEKGAKSYRSIKVNGEELEFSGGFEDLHVQSYKCILDGNGFGLLDSRPAIELCSSIRHSESSPAKEDYHPMIKMPTSRHPFR